MKTVHVKTSVSGAGHRVRSGRQSPREARSADREGAAGQSSGEAAGARSRGSWAPSADLEGQVTGSAWSPATTTPSRVPGPGGDMRGRPGLRTRAEAGSHRHGRPRAPREWVRRPNRSAGDEAKRRGPGPGGRRRPRRQLRAPRGPGTWTRTERSSSGPSRAHPRSEARLRRRGVHELRRRSRYLTRRVPSRKAAERRVHVPVSQAAGSFPASRARGAAGGRGRPVSASQPRRRVSREHSAAPAGLAPPPRALTAPRALPARRPGKRHGERP